MDVTDIQPRRAAFHIQKSCALVLPLMALAMSPVWAIDVPNIVKLGSGRAFTFNAILERDRGTIELIFAAKADLPPAPKPVSPTVNDQAKGGDADQARVPVADQKKAKGPDTPVNFVWPQPEFPSMVLITNASSRSARLTLYLRGDRKSLGFSNGSSVDWLDADFSDGLYHHLVLCTTAGITEVYLDQKYIGYFRVGYGPYLNDFWRVGAQDVGVNEFVGELATVRIWDRALSPVSPGPTSDQLAQLPSEIDLLEVYGAPDPTHPAISDLLAYSQFADSALMVSTRAARSPAGTVNNAAGRLDSRLFPKNARLTSLGVSYRTITLGEGPSATKRSQLLDIDPTFELPGAPGTPAKSWTAIDWAVDRAKRDASLADAAMIRAVRYEFDRVDAWHKSVRNQPTGVVLANRLNLEGLRRTVLLLSRIADGQKLPDDLRGALEETLSRLQLVPSEDPKGGIPSRIAAVITDPRIKRLALALDRYLIERSVVVPERGENPIMTWPQILPRKLRVLQLAQTAAHQLEQASLWFDAAKIRSKWSKSSSPPGENYAKVAQLITTLSNPAADRSLIAEMTQLADTAVQELGTYTARSADGVRAVPAERFDSLLLALTLIKEEFAKSNPITPELLRIDPATTKLYEIKQTKFNLRDGEVLAGIAGTTSDTVNTIRFITNQRIGEVMGDSQNPGANPYYVPIPQSAGFVGFNQFVSVEGVASIQPVYELLPLAMDVPKWAEKHPMLPPGLDAGRYVPEGAQMPVRNDQLIMNLAAQSESDSSPDQAKDVMAQGMARRAAKRLIHPKHGRVLPHANYSSFPVCNLWYTVDGGIVVALDDPDPPFGGMKVRDSILAPVKGDASRYRSKDFEVVFLKDGQFTLRDLSKSQETPVRYYAPTVANSSVDGQKLPWGATFSSEQRPILAEFNVRGYYLPKLNPRNYQLGTGTTKNVFEWPSDDSLEYQTTAAGKIIPRGMFFRTDREGNGSVRSTSVSSAQEHQESWSVDLGVSGGIPFIGSFSANTSYKSESASMSKKEHGRTVSVTHQVKHALVLDRSTMRLDASFYARVLRLRNLYLAGGLDTAGEYQALVRDYGTSYPHAVAYGGAAYQEKQYSAAEQMAMNGSDFSFSASAQAELEGLGGGVSGGYGQTVRDTNTNANRKESDSIFTIGGETSQGGGWSIPERSEVPILLDLRPLDELLSPIYFSDKLVWTEIRRKLSEELSRLEPGYGDDNFSPLLVNVRLLELLNATNRTWGTRTGDVGGNNMRIGIKAAAFVRRTSAKPIVPSEFGADPTPVGFGSRATLPSAGNTSHWEPVPIPASLKEFPNDLFTADIRGSDDLGYPNVLLPRLDPPELVRLGTRDAVKARAGLGGAIPPNDWIPEKLRKLQTGLRRWKSPYDGAPYVSDRPYRGTIYDAIQRIEKNATNLSGDDGDFLIKYLLSDVQPLPERPVQFFSLIDFDPGVTLVPGYNPVANSRDPKATPFTFAFPAYPNDPKEPMSDGRDRFHRKYRIQLTLVQGNNAQPGDINNPKLVIRDVLDATRPGRPSLIGKGVRFGSREFTTPEGYVSSSMELNYDSQPTRSWQGDVVVFDWDPRKPAVQAILVLDEPYIHNERKGPNPPRDPVPATNPREMKIVIEQPMRRSGS